jgi:hypothetical protein
MASARPLVATQEKTTKKSSEKNSDGFFDFLKFIFV